MRGRRTRTRTRRSLSFVRLLTALTVVVGCVTGAALTVRHAINIAPSAGPKPWFAPYVDVTATPTLHFEEPSSNPASVVVLGFVVAPRTRQCVPTWGTYYDLAHAGTELDLDRRITRLRDRGGDLIVSFGGQANDELARDCRSVDALTTAYSSVVSRYRLGAVDFDIEGAALDDHAANERRAAAIRRLQTTAQARHDQLSVWLTLPVAPTGMPDGAVAVIDSMLRAHVALAGVNLMTMDYGESRVVASGTRLSMVQATERALDAAAVQLDHAYRRAHVVLGRSALWKKLGMTPMIGQNDIAGERVTVADAMKLTDFAIRRGVARISMWSVNRDTPCGAQLDAGIVSDSCSGITQKPLAFSNVFTQLRRAPSGADEPSTASIVPPESRDDPAHSPYPIWSDATTYRAGDKITWHHNVYEAKWWSQQDVPDAPVAHEWDTPWRYLGPVMPGDHPPVTVPLPKGTYPEWRAGDVYVKGDRVQLGGTAYEAKWWTLGDRPDRPVDQPWDSPWQALARPTTAPDAGS